jgi:hypothetical protein
LNNLEEEINNEEDDFIEEAKSAFYSATGNADTHRDLNTSVLTLDELTNVIELNGEIEN